MATYTDDFNRPDSTNLGNWTEHGDDWSIKSNQLAPGISTLSFVLYGSALDTSDHYAEIVLSNATATSMGVLARADVNGTNFYLWRNNGTSWSLFHNLGGSFTSVGSFVAAPANGDVARIQCVGSTVKGFVNGIERVSVTDTTITTGAYVGMRSEASSTMRYDNFAASDIGTTVNTSAFFSFLRA
jgi:hypothetical protein